MLTLNSYKGANPPPRPVRTWLYLVCGTAIGIVAGVLEALISAIGEPDYWSRVHLYYFQLGFGGWFFGLIGGLIAARRVRSLRHRRWHARLVRGQCVTCGYDLRGNVTERCPECGAKAVREGSFKRYVVWP